MSKKYPRGEFTLKININTVRFRERQEWKLSCQRLNVMKMSNRCPFLPKVSSEKRRFPDSNDSVQCQIVFGKREEISCFIIRFQIIRKRVQPIRWRSIALCSAWRLLFTHLTLRLSSASCLLIGICSIFSFNATATELSLLQCLSRHLVQIHFRKCISQSPGGITGL